MVRDVSVDEFRNMLHERILLVEFYSPRDPSSRSQDSVLDSLDWSANIPIAKVNVDKLRNITSDNRVTRVPTYIIFKNSNEVRRLEGTQSKDKLLREIRNYK